MRVAIIAVIVALMPCAAVAQQGPADMRNREAVKAFSEGIDAYKKGDYNSAINSFTTAIQLDPTYGEAYYHRALVFDDVPWRRQEPRATEDYTQAIKFNPANADAYLRRGIRIRGPYPKSAIEDFNNAIRIRPDFGEAYYYRGVVRSQSPGYWLRRINSGGLEQARLKDYREELGTDSQKMEEVIAHLSKVIRSAIPDLAKAIELNPKYVEAYSYLAKVYSVLGEHENAISEWTHVLAVSNDNADAYYRRGLAYLELKQYEKANQDFTEVIRLRPADTEAYSMRVIARFNLKAFDGALEDYVAVLRIQASELLDRNYDQPEMDDREVERTELENFDRISASLPKTAQASLADAYYQRALANRYHDNPRQVDQKKAEADLTRALTLDPSHVAARYEKGLTLIDLELYPAAIETLSDVIRLQPQNAEAYYARGVAARKLRSYRPALQDLSRAIQLSPKFTKAYFERGRVYAELGNQRSAIDDLNRAIALNSEFIDAYYSRALAYEKLGLNQKAIADYIQVVRLAAPDDRFEGDQTEQLGAKLATVFHRGVARVRLARLLNSFLPSDRSKSEQLAKKDYLESAERDFAQVIAARPAFANVYTQRSRAREMNRLKGTDNYAEDEEGALADLTKAIEVNPRYVNGYFARAAKFWDDFKLAEAISDYTRIIELEPGNAEAFYKRARVYHTGSAGDAARVKAAIENCNLAIKANPRYVEAYFLRAELLRETDPLRALADYTQIIQLEPDNVDAYRGRGAINKQLKDYQNAIADYTRAIELDPSEPGSDERGAAYTFANRAYVRFEAGDGKGAVEDYLHALLIRPCLYCVSGSTAVSQANKAEAFLQKGLALLRRGDKEASRQNLEQAARLFYTQGDMPKYQSVKYHLSRF